jgi:surface protein
MGSFAFARREPVVPLPNEFRTTWNTSRSGTSNSQQISLPLVSSGSFYNFVVDWGDGNQDTITAWDDAAKTHTYNTPGVYDVTINGELRGWEFNGGGDAQKLERISRWGPFQTGLNTGGTFYGCSNMTCTASDTLNTISANFNELFRSCTSFNNSAVIHWDVSSVTNMQGAFQGCSSFNGDVSTWDTANVTDMGNLFRDCTVFNQDIGNWNTHKVTDMGAVFTSAAGTHTMSHK